MFPSIPHLQPETVAAVVVEDVVDAVVDDVVEAVVEEEVVEAVDAVVAVEAVDAVVVPAVVGATVVVVVDVEGFKAMAIRLLSKLARNEAMTMGTIFEASPS